LNLSALRLTNLSRDEAGVKLVVYSVRGDTTPTTGAMALSAKWLLTVAVVGLSMERVGADVSDCSHTFAGGQTFDLSGLRKAQGASDWYVRVGSGCAKATLLVQAWQTVH
jgi:hypothetical protein